MSLRAKAPFQTGVDTTDPLKTLSHSHDAILSRLGSLAELPRQVEQMAKAQRGAAAALTLFKSDILEHHADEERDHFPAVVRSAEKGEEREQVQAMVAQLKAEHRELERMWRTLAPALRAAAKGQPKEMDARLVTRLVQCYTDHAHFEEERFLPLAQVILERNSNHLGAVGLALHLRRTPPVSGHI
jgi:hemerythrin-like domain-containing protein